MTRAGAALLLLAATAAAQGRRGAAPDTSRHGTVVTDTLWSQALGASKSLVVYLPPSYRTDPDRRYPVAYYLHGAWGSETDWTRVGRIDRVMDSLVARGLAEMIIAMPDGDDSWYTTFNLLLDTAGCRRLLPPSGNAERDCVAWPHYDDYIAYDVVRHVDAKYRTMPNMANRAIAGLSMGGFGAFSLAFQYPAIFGAAASHSGAFMPVEWAPAAARPPRITRTGADSTAAARFGAGLKDRFRAVFGTDSAGWWSRDPATLGIRAKARGVVLPALYADVGTEDLFLAHNRELIRRLYAAGITVAYTPAPGGHTWEFWRARVPTSLNWIGRQIGGRSARR